MLYDAHTHNPARREGVLRVCNLRTEDWSDASSFAPFCAGIHPQELAAEIPAELLSRLEELLKTPGTVALGECGLDRLAKAPMELQTALFLEQAKLAERLSLPLVIHCVRAIPEIIAARKTLKAKTPWLLHGFRGNAQSAKELVRHGIKLSFGAAIAMPIETLHEALRSLAPTDFLLETDEATTPIEDIYSAAASVRTETLENLKAKLEVNFKRLFASSL